MGAAEFTGERGNEVDEILDCLRRVIHVLYSHSRRVERLAGLTSAQAWLLTMLAGREPARISDLSRDMHLTPSAVVRIAGRLEARGLIVRTRSSGDHWGQGGDDAPGDEAGRENSRDSPGTPSERPHGDPPEPAAVDFGKPGVADSDFGRKRGDAAPLLRPRRKPAGRRKRRLTSGDAAGSGGARKALCLLEVAPGREDVTGVPPSSPNLPLSSRLPCGKKEDPQMRILRLFSISGGESIGGCPGGRTGWKPGG